MPGGRPEAEDVRERKAPQDQEPKCCPGALRLRTAGSAAGSSLQAAAAQGAGSPPLQDNTPRGALGLQKYSPKDPLQEWALPGRVGVLRPLGRSLRRAEEVEERLCLPRGAPSWEWRRGRSTTQTAGRPKEGHPPGRKVGAEKKEELGQGELTQSLWALLRSRPAGRPGPWAASSPRPLLPSSPPAAAVSCGCDSGSAMSSPPLMGCSCLAAPAPAFHPHPLLPALEPTMALQVSPHLLPPPTRAPGNTEGVCVLTHTLWAGIVRWFLACQPLEWLPWAVQSRGDERAALE